jgi:chemotaxis protein methyltransferase CheR
MNPTFTKSSREYAFVQADFRRVCRLIYQRAGIVLNDNKEDMVYGRLSRRLRLLGMRSVGDYLDRLEAGAIPNEWEGFTNALTTNLTAFFREPHHFELFKTLLSQAAPEQQQLIWCAAASTGEEAYSLAISAIEHYRSLTPPVAILATDIDTQVLETARRGIYPLERVEGMHPDRLKRFFLRGSGEHAGSCKVIDAVQRLIGWRSLNLVDSQWGLKGPFDAVFCRNVMIYFDKDTQRRIIQRMLPLMRDNSRFFAGHSESFSHCADLLSPCGRTVYQPLAMQPSPVPAAPAGVQPCWSAP